MRADVVTLTERLVRVDTAPGRSTRPLVELLVEEIEALGGRTSVQEGLQDGVVQQNLVARFGGDGPAGLLLAGHLDTVPWEEGSQATIEPARDGRTLYGRGTCDMKGAVAAQLEAVAALRDQLRRPLVLMWTYAEEVGCHGALRLVDEKGLLGDLSGAVGIVGEPTDLQPITSHKGYGVVRIRLTGHSVHSSDPWAGSDASVALAILLRDLHELREALRREAPEGSPHEPPCTTLNTGLVTAGTARNVVPDRAEVCVEFRPLPGADVEDLRRRIQACTDLACAAVPGVNATLLWDECHPAFHQEPAERLVEWLVDRTGIETGVVPFYTEAEIFRSALAVPVVVCGPGSISKAHRVDECVDFEQLAAGQVLYEDAIKAFCL